MNKTAMEAMTPEIRNRPAKGPGPKPDPPSNLLWFEQLEVDSNVASKSGISLLSISSVIDKDMSKVRGDPLGKAYIHA